MGVMNTGHYHATLHIVNCGAIARMRGHVCVTANRDDLAVGDGHRIGPAVVGIDRVDLRVQVNRVSGCRLRSSGRLAAGRENCRYNRKA